MLSFGARSFFGKPVSVSLVGSDINELDQRDGRPQSRAGTQLSELADVVDNNQEGLREINISLKDKGPLPGAWTYRTSSGRSVSAFFGAEAQRLQRGEDEVRVWLRYGENEPSQHRPTYNNMRIRYGGWGRVSALRDRRPGAPAGRHRHQPRRRASGR